jgi:hypothetical protein
MDTQTIIQMIARGGHWNESLSPEGAKILFEQSKSSAYSPSALKRITDHFQLDELKSTYDDIKRLSKKQTGSTTLYVIPYHLSDNTLQIAWVDASGIVASFDTGHKRNDTGTRQRDHALTFRRKKIKDLLIEDNGVVKWLSDMGMSHREWEKKKYQDYKKRRRQESKLKHEREEREVARENKNYLETKNERRRQEVSQIVMVDKVSEFYYRHRNSDSDIKGNKKELWGALLSVPFPQHKLITSEQKLSWLKSLKIKDQILIEKFYDQYL